MTRAIGSIRRINERGFGFLKVDGDGRDCYFHATDLPNGKLFGDYLLNKRVSFEVVTNERGIRAHNIEMLESKDG